MVKVNIYITLGKTVESNINSKHVNQDLKQKLF